MRRIVRFGVIVLLAGGCRAAESPTALDGSAGAVPAGASEVDVVVVLKAAFAPGGHDANLARAAEIAREFGVSARHAYGTALFGFAGAIPAGRLTALRADPRVESVELDREWPLAAQTVPTGIDRIEADRNPNADIDGDDSTVDLDVAIVDTGIDPTHPDLNVAGGINLTGKSTSSWSDGNGHGSHVAGTVGARDNGIGVVGVAPGVRVWAVKVCGSNGLCWSSDIAAGIDWVAARKNDAKTGGSFPINFASANMSISTQDDATACNSNSDSVHKAICGVVNEGVVFALAAGNESALKLAYPEAFTVAAVADFDGKPGGVGSPTCRTDVDDTLADFSNYGPTIDIAAPGVCILSTWKSGAYATISGTSMATPHVTGAVALYLHANHQAPATNAAGVAAITNAIIAAGQPVGGACGYTNERGGSQPLLFVNGAAFGGNGSCDPVPGGPPPPVDDPPSVSISSPGSGDAVSGTITVAAVASDDNGVSQVEFFVDGSPIGTDTSAAGGWSTSWNTTTVGDGSHSLTARATDTASQATTSAAVSVTVSNGGGGGGGTMHVGDLTGSKNLKGKSSNWEAFATVLVHDSAHDAVASATVTGTWSTGGSASGVTGSAGDVRLGSGNLSSATSATFTVTSITHATLSYDASGNHDPAPTGEVTVNK